MKTLNKQQLLAAETTEGPVRIIAGPGSGKTKTIISKMTHLINDKKVPYWKLLGITFTNKAAGEMKERLSQNISGSEIPRIMTYHGFCAYFLRMESEHFHFGSDYLILDTSDQKSMVNKLKKEFEELERASFWDLNEKFDIYRHNEDKFNRDLKDKVSFAVLFSNYTKNKIKTNSLDFDDLIIEVSKILHTNKEVSKKWTKKYDYLFIDEFQDTDDNQYKIIKALTTKTSNITVVGDPDQNIYSWRGANLSIILNFKKDYPGTKDILLEQNYRSTKKIISASNDLISNNNERIEMHLFTNNEEGERVTVSEKSSDESEAEGVSNRINKYIKSGIDPRNIAIIYRLNSISTKFEIALSNLDIDYKLIGGFRFLDRKNVKQVFDFLHFALKQDDFILERIINVPTRGVGIVTINKIKNSAFFSGETLWGHIKQNVEKYPKLKNFVNLTIQIIADLKEHESIEDFFNYLDKIGLVSMYSSSEERNSEIFELFDILRSEIENSDASLIDSVFKYRQESSLLSSSDESTSKGQVTLMTAHSSKGSEYDIVFVVGMKEEVFPHFMNNNTEEERRLAYVAFTRAKKRLHVSYSMASNYNTYTIYPSRFISESNLSITTYNLREKNVISEIDVPENYVNTSEIKKGDLVYHTVYNDGVIIDFDDSFVKIIFAKKIGEKEILRGHRTLYIKKNGQ